MPEITEQTEIQAAAFRAKTRQNKAQPWLIRDDGMIFPNTPLLARMKTLRVYTGKLDAPLDERMRYLQGLPSKRTIVFDETTPFNISKASKTELISFAMEEFSEPIDESEHLNKVRSVVCALAGLDYIEIFGNQRNAPAAAGLQQPGA